MIDLAAVATPLVVGAAALAARRGLPALPNLSRFLEGRWAPVVVGLVTAVLTAGMWGSLREPAHIHDEAAYLLQAELIASGRIVGPPAPLPEFFEQYHVLVTPHLAPKYPPGHALVLAPGVALGLPGLMPVLTTGLAGGLLFGVARRLSNSWVALVSWVLWSAAPGVLSVSSTYLSNTTSLASWLGAVAAFLEWRRTGRRRWLAATGFLGGWTVLTRPLTGLALGLPLAVVLIRDAVRERDWRAVALPAAFGAIALAPLPVWNQASTGDWRVTAYEVYTRTYIPWDRLGFGLDSSPPARPLPPDMQRFSEDYRRVRAAYRPGIVPAVFVARVNHYGRDMWGGSPWRWALVLLVVPGIVGGGAGALAAAGTVLLLTLVHLAYAHPPEWTPYYYEILPALAFLTALGLWLLLVRVQPPDRRAHPGGTASAGTAMAILALLAFGLSLHDAAAAREGLANRRSYHRGIRRALSRVPEGRAVVFVRYHPQHSPYYSLIENPPDYEAARLWIVRDRGEDNDRLLRLAPERVPYLLDEASGTLKRLEPSTP